MLPAPSLDRHEAQDYSRYLKRTTTKRESSINAGYGVQHYNPSHHY